ncbi:hypothetical protein [Nitratireductor sp. XY-223]|uniref:hypothetical protein n=1 Tax=Nitratireductor sp. XY-223 TaxID=2561926 RepID=UPI0010A9F3D9|nr:hypothetical protein [Nitratireductor sp. XY-223]
MGQALQNLWRRLSIVEARIQQENARLQADDVRLSLLKQMKADLRTRIRAAEVDDRQPAPDAAQDTRLPA